MAEWFRIEALVDLAVAPPGSVSLAPIEGRRLAVEARDALDELSGRREAEVKRVLSLVLNAVTALERQMEVLQRRWMLQNHGVTLKPHQVRIGADGLVTREPLLVTGPALVHLGLNMRGQQHLLSLNAEVSGDGLRVDFIDPEPFDRDTLVAFTFEQERRERRRELDSVDPG